MTCDPGVYLLVVLVFAVMAGIVCPVGFGMGRLYEQLQQRTEPKDRL